MSGGRSHEHAVRILFGAFGPTPPTDAQMGAFLVALVDLPGDAVFDAVVGIVRCSRTMATPSDVRADVLSAGTLGPISAWMEVESMIGAVGHVGRPTFSDPLIGQAVRAVGGWAALCASTDHDGDRWRFFDVFGVLARQAGRERLASAGVTGDSDDAGRGEVG